MDLIALLRLTKRRWLVVLPVLLLTVFGLASLVVNRSADYRMTGSYVLVSADTLDPAQPALDPTQAADQIMAELQRPSWQHQLEDEGLSPNYTVTLSDVGTTLKVIVTGDSAQIVTDTATRLVDLLPQVQASALGEQSDTISARVLAEPDVNDVAQTANGASYSLATSIAVSAVPTNSGNPFGANLGTVQSLISVAASPQFAEAVKAAAPGATYIVTNTVQNTPILGIEVTALTPGAAQDGYTFVRDQLKASLATLQDGVDVNQTYRTVLQPIVEPTTPTETAASVVRPAAGIVILGAGFAIALAVLAESIAVGRRQRRAARAERKAGSAALSDGPPPADPATEASAARRVDGVSASQRAEAGAPRELALTTENDVASADAPAPRHDTRMVRKPKNRAEVRRVDNGATARDADGVASRQAVTSPSGSAPRSSSVRNTQ